MNRLNPITNCITVSYTFLHPETHNSEKVDSVRYMRPENMLIDEFTQYVQRESDKHVVNLRDTLTHQKHHVFVEDTQYSFTTPKQTQLFVAPSQRLSVPADQILILIDYSYEQLPSSNMVEYTQIL